MLPLRGVATVATGFSVEATRQVIRLGAPARRPEGPSDAALLIRADDWNVASQSGYETAVILGEPPNEVDGGANIARTLVLPSTCGYLSDGDVLGFHPQTRRFRTLYRRNSNHNSFLVTERCNHYCLMCSQPPRDIDDRWILDEIREALPFIDKSTYSLGFTGGEPLLDWQSFAGALHDCRTLLPDTAIHVLSNGRAFADSQVTQAWAAIAHPNLMVGIPIYAAVDHVHDYVVQAKGAFDETVLGVLKLKDKGQRVEIRVVLHAVTAPVIVETSRWLARNLPFVDHVALMGLENTGFAIANDALLWMDPIDYRDQLAEAVEILAAAKVRVSVYNLPRCVLDRSVWPYAAQSISDWKNNYLPDCDRCDEKPRCSGFFATGRPRYSRGIAPILS